MSLRIFQFIIVLVLSISVVFGQTDSAKIHHDTFNSYDDLRKKQKDKGIDTLAYLDLDYNFQVKIPNWLALKETNTPDLLGGTLPAVNGIENAILVSGFPKSGFKSFEEFKEIYSTANTIGKPAKFNKELIWFGANPQVKIEHGVKQKLFIFWQNKIYHEQFILLETKSAYLWIRFVATQETYENNISKFDEFMAGFQLTNL